MIFLSLYFKNITFILFKFDYFIKYRLPPQPLHIYRKLVYFTWYINLEFQYGSTIFFGKVVRGTLTNVNI